MSRAFVKERDNAPEPTIGLPERTHPNFVTPRGLHQLHERRRGATDPREIEKLDRSIADAIVKKPPKNRAEVAFGATVRVDDGAGFDREFTIVGEDEADPAAGKISHTSPLADALDGAKVGQRVVWERPAGNLKLTVREIRYEEDKTA